MVMAEQNRDIATLFGDAYSKSAPRVLGDQHGFLLNTLETKLADKNDPVVLVLGPGGQVLPYSCQYTDGKLGDSNRDRMKKIIRDGKLILLDYVLDFDQNGLVKGLYTLTKTGFFDKAADGSVIFNVGKFATGETINPADLKPATVSFVKNNLRDNLKVADSSVDLVEATLSIHHASVTRDELRRVYREISRVLKPGGIVHLGEGNVNMNYSEDKLIRIGQDVCEYLGTPVHLEDNRDSGNGYVLNAMFVPGKKYDRLPAFSKLKDAVLPAEVLVDKDGIVHVTAQKPIDLMRTLHGKGYKSLSIEHGSAVTMPLIDPSMPEDVAGHIVPVDGYYAAIKSRIVRGYQGVDDELVAKISKGLADESGKARKGIVEYYMGEPQILAALNDVGFKDVQVKHHEIEPFYNITAVKP